MANTHRRVKIVSRNIPAKQLELLLTVAAETKCPLTVASKNYTLSVHVTDIRDLITGQELDTLPTQFARPDEWLKVNVAPSADTTAAAFWETFEQFRQNPPAKMA